VFWVDLDGRWRWWALDESEGCARFRWSCLDENCVSRIFIRFWWTDAIPWCHRPGWETRTTHVSYVMIKPFFWLSIFTCAITYSPILNQLMVSLISESNSLSLIKLTENILISTTLNVYVYCGLKTILVLC
jgi:hypothetical protein